MSEPKTHTGGCHCGRVRYRATLSLGAVIECNCSICSKKGHLLAFIPAEQFELVSGEGELTDYQFNKNVIHHLFCKVCGIESFARGMGPDGQPKVAINARCLDDVDLGSLERMAFDGKSR